MFDDTTEDYPKSIPAKIVGIIWRSIIIGVAYTFTTLFLGSFLAKQGIPFPNIIDSEMNKLWFLGSAILMGFVIGAISQIVHTSKPNHIMSWTILLFLNPLSVTLESAFIAPQVLKASTIPALMLVQFVSALVTAFFITFLFASSSKQPFGSYFHRPWSSWGIRISLCIGIALLLYSLFGATNYHLVSKLYSQNYPTTLPLPTIEVVFAIQFIKALLVVLSLIPMIITIGATKRFIAIMSGITLVVLGALSPFLQTSNLSMFLLMASSAKIFIQNFFIGICTGFLLGYPSKLEENGISIRDFLRPLLRAWLNSIGQFLQKYLGFLWWKKKKANEDEPAEQEQEQEEVAEKKEAEKKEDHQEPIVEPVNETMDPSSVEVSPPNHE